MKQTCPRPAVRATAVLCAIVAMTACVPKPMERMEPAATAGPTPPRVTVAIPTAPPATPLALPTTRPIFAPSVREREQALLRKGADDVHAYARKYVGETYVASWSPRAYQGDVANTPADERAGKRVLPGGANNVAKCEYSSKGVREPCELAFARGIETAYSWPDAVWIVVSFAPDRAVVVYRTAMRYEFPVPVVMAHVYDEVEYIWMEQEWREQTRTVRAYVVDAVSKSRPIPVLAPGSLALSKDITLTVGITVPLAMADLSVTSEAEADVLLSAQTYGAIVFTVKDLTRVRAGYFRNGIPVPSQCRADVLVHTAYRALELQDSSFGMCVVGESHSAGFAPPERLPDGRVVIRGVTEAMR
jgi:hypothetical protein